jgi:mannose-6-phosphate isomerase-like protein (cupin superfamily)
MDKLNKLNKRVTKRWGYEEWLTVSDSYVLKKLHIAKDKSITLQYHKEKDETWYVLDGSGIMIYNREMGPIRANDFVRIEPGVIHQVTGTGENGITIIEASTNHLEDVVYVKGEHNVHSRDRN